MLAPTPTRSTKPAHCRSLASFVAHVRDWLRTSADAYTAARTYEELRHLSDSELSRLSQTSGQGRAVTYKVFRSEVFWTRRRVAARFRKFGGV